MNLALALGGWPGWSVGGALASESLVAAGEEVTVLHHGSANYLCETGDLLQVRFFVLSDASLRFVKLTWPGGHVHTLPQLVAASGVRYTQDGGLVVWLKGTSMRVERLGDDGQWLTPFGACTEVNPDR